MCRGEKRRDQEWAEIQAATHFCRVEVSEQENRRTMMTKWYSVHMATMMTAINLSAQTADSTTQPWQQQNVGQAAAPSAPSPLPTPAINPAVCSKWALCFEVNFDLLDGK
jgi:hypothetical protein